MEPQEERMLDELNELNERIDKLSKSINSVQWLALCYREQELIIEKINAMTAYRGVLWRMAQRPTLSALCLSIEHNEVTLINRLKPKGEFDAEFIRFNKEFFAAASEDETSAD